MDQNHFTTDTLRKKGAHLTFEERVIIQTRLRDKQSYRSIAREIGCCINTVRNEVKRGKVLCYNGKVERYRAADGQSTYEAHRENCGRKCDAIAKGAFLDYVQKKLQEHHWSLDACFGRALVTGEFQCGEMVCTKTLYNYVTLGLLGKIKSIDLPLRVKRKNAKKRVRERKKKFGRSIDERDPSVDERQDFGHWECDLVLGSRSKDEVLLTLVERKTRCSLIRKLPNKESASVIAAFRKLKDGMFRDCFSRVFLSITTDNGSEFSSLSELEKLSHTRIYYAHPYCSSDKGTNENHNGLFRRFLPKGKKIQDYPVEHISRVECWANTLPRKILGYKTPEECFREEMLAALTA